MAYGGDDRSLYELKGVMWINDKNKTRHKWILSKWQGIQFVYGLGNRQSNNLLLSEIYYTFVCKLLLYYTN